MGCRHPPKRADIAGGGSEEIGDGFGAGTGSEVDGVGVEVGADAGVTCSDRSEDVGSASGIVVGGTVVGGLVDDTAIGEVGHR